MPNKFILIEHAMRNLGGHYYTYATSVLEAAERAGFQPVLATHQDFTEFDAFPATWQVHALFPRRSQWLHVVGSVSVDTHGSSIFQWWRKWNDARRTRRRLRRTKEFAGACRKLFNRVPLKKGDHVFIATASDLDFYALSKFLRDNPTSNCAYWHLQFHHALFKGRDPDYAAQFESTAQLRTFFSAALASIPQHQLRFYCTTEELAQQYSFLDVAKFEPIPYVIHSIFHRRERAPTNDPLQISCLGQIRAEKGDNQLPALVKSLWDVYLQSGQAQLLLQSSEPELRDELLTLVTRLNNEKPTTTSSTTPLRFASFPLPLEGYADLVHQSDIGLLFYDSDIYFARCSGLLLEMLIAGKPVIVPTGCWLSLLIAEETQRYLAQLGNEAPATSTINCDTTRIETSIYFEINCDSSARALMISFDWRQPNSDGIFLRVSLEQLDQHGNLLHSGSEVLNHSANDDTIRTLFSLVPTTQKARISFANEWCSQRVDITNIRCTFLASRSPSGIVGLTAHNVNDIPERLREIIDHLDHYRRGAELFGKRLRELHDGMRVVNQLTHSVATHT